MQQPMALGPGRPAAVVPLRSLGRSCTATLRRTTSFSNRPTRSATSPSTSSSSTLGSPSSGRMRRCSAACALRSLTSAEGTGCRRRVSPPQRAGALQVMESFVGTLAYTSPEVVQYEGYTEKVDIWSLGCILYQMATCKSGFLLTAAAACRRSCSVIGFSAGSDLRALPAVVKLPFTVG